MSLPVISVEHLSKAYRLGMKEEIPDTFVGAATGWLKAPFRNFKKLRALDTTGSGSASSVVPGASSPEPGTTNEALGTKHHAPELDLLWALRDVSFDIHEGEVVGIIGRNGAGKSTLLKILSRITEPTHGRAVIRGRVSSLLEVGTGFHPELSGRENIYMNGTILGMRKKEIDRKFDEMVAFSGVEKFLDTPIKRYSSGMQVRLAFSVAAHLEPEILIVDEVLAVGDADFQSKCIGKMNEIAAGGRTVLFVSHNLSVLQSLCTTGITLAGGQVQFGGEISAAVDDYLKGLESQASEDLATRTDRRGKGEIRFRKVSVSSGPGGPENVLFTGRPANFRFELTRRDHELDVCFIVYDRRGNAVSYLSNWPRSGADVPPEPGDNSVCCRVDMLPLRAGQYHLTVQVNLNREEQDRIDGAVFFTVEAGEYAGRSLPYPNVPGVVCLAHRWGPASLTETESVFCHAR